MNANVSIQFFPKAGDDQYEEKLHLSLNGDVDLIKAVIQRELASVELAALRPSVQVSSEDLTVQADLHTEIARLIRPPAEEAQD